MDPPSGLEIVLTDMLKIQSSILDQLDHIDERLRNIESGLYDLCVRVPPAPFPPAPVRPAPVRPAPIRPSLPAPVPPAEVPPAPVVPPSEVPPAPAVPPAAVGSSKWKPNEIDELIRLKCKHEYSWKEVSDGLAKKNIIRTEKMCRDKWCKMTAVLKSYLDMAKPFVEGPNYLGPLYTCITGKGKGVAEGSAAAAEGSAVGDAAGAEGGNGTADQHHVQLPMQAPFASGSHSVNPAISLADQPLGFAPRFNGHNDSATVSGEPPMNNWTPSVAPGVGYTPISPVFASGTQHDPSISTSPVPGHVAPPFGRFPGPGLPPPIPPGAAPFAINAGTTMLPAPAFSGDAYGVPGVPKRPKKASVPDWRRDEIKKAVIAPPVEYPKEESKFMNDVLTKVHELFDEIALKVSREDDLTSEVVSNQKASASPPSIPVHKTAAKVLVPVKVKEPEHDADSEKSNSSSAVDVLGLGNYASDAEDEDGGMDGSSVPNLKDIKNSVEDVHEVSANSSSQLKSEENGRSQTNLVSNLGKTGNGVAVGEFYDDKVTKKLDHLQPSKDVPEDWSNELNAFERKHDRSNGKATGVEKTTEDPLVRENRKGREKADGHAYNSSVEAKNVQNSKIKVEEKANEDYRRKDERHQKKEKADGSNEVKERRKDDSVRHGDKTRDSKSRRKSSLVDAKGDNKEAEKSHRGRSKEQSRDKGEHKSRHKESSKSDKHRRKRSSPVSSRGRSSWDQAVDHTSESSDGGSDVSKRKLHSRRRDSSPSPVRTRTRQVSRSPHSKRSQRRHSPYSSLETSRRRRSRSRSPVRRHR